MNEQRLAAKTEQLVSPEDQAKLELDAFAYNEGLAEVATLFGAKGLPERPDAAAPNPPEELRMARAQRLAMLQRVAADHWDFRKGAERQTVNWDDALLDQQGSEQWNTIFNGADKLGQVRNTMPINKTPTYLAVLGGANHAPYDRLQYGLEVVDNFEHVVYLGSSRVVGDKEREQASDYAPEAKTEFELGCGAFEVILGAEQVGKDVITERDGDVWITREYTFLHNGERKTGFVLSTPQTIGAKRANTYDNYRFFADRADLSQDSAASVVAVTTAFYAPAQQLAGVQEITARYGTQLETIGHSAEYSGKARKPSQLLQEMKSAIDAAVRLHNELGRAEQQIGVDK